MQPNRQVKATVTCHLSTINYLLCEAMGARRKSKRIVSTAMPHNIAQTMVGDTEQTVTKEVTLIINYRPSLCFLLTQKVPLAANPVTFGVIFVVGVLILECIHCPLYLFAFVVIF